MVFNRNFYTDLFELKKVPSTYKNISSLYNNTTESQDKNYNLYNISKRKIGSLQLLPNYLNTEIKEGIILKKIFQKQGYAANLSSCNTIENYVKTHFKSRFRNNIKRSVKRVENCLDISYKMYYGDISVDEYKYLMKCFHNMLEKRFQQRNNVKNTTLENWEHYAKISFNLINNKEASLFVMLNKEEAIAFSLNFHFNNVFYFAIPTFNLDYSKFTLGNVVIYKNLEWCLNNNFNLFDMGYGGFENKINWCNTTYNFEHHLLFNSKNILGYLYAPILKYKYILINYLITKNINTVYRNLKNYLLRKKKLEVLGYKVSNNDCIEDLNELNPINFNDYKHKSIKKPVYDFLYSTNEHIDNVQVFKLENKMNTYTIKGIKGQIIIKID